MNEFMELFIKESKAYLVRLKANIYSLKKDMNNFKIVDDIFRILHSIKGMSGMMELVDIYEYIHELENLLQPVKLKKLPIDEDFINKLCAGVDEFEKMLDILIKKNEAIKNIEITDKIKIELLFEKIKKMVYELENKSNKKVKLEINSNLDKIDMNIVNRISDIIIQLVRNGIDHGIESSEIRINKNKNEEGHLKIEITKKNSKLYIIVEDDGNGIDFNIIKQKAKDRGILDDEAMKFISDKELIDLLFLPGFSTSEKITTVSGRGYGLDIVKEQVLELNGTIKLDSDLTKGTKVEVVIPI